MEGLAQASLELASKRRGTAKRHSTALPSPAHGGDLSGFSQLDIHHQAPTPMAASHKVIDPCLDIPLAPPLRSVIIQAASGKELSPIRALNLHSIRVQDQVAFEAADIDSWRRGPAVHNALQLYLELVDTLLMKARVYLSFVVANSLLLLSTRSPQWRLGGT